MGITGEMVEGTVQPPPSLSTRVIFLAKRTTPLETNPHTGNEEFGTQDPCRYQFEGELSSSKNSLEIRLFRPGIDHVETYRMVSHAELAEAQGSPLKPPTDGIKRPEASLFADSLSIAETRLRQSKMELQKAKDALKNGIHTPEAPIQRKTELAMVLDSVLGKWGGKREWVCFRNHTFWSTSAKDLSKTELITAAVHYMYSHGAVVKGTDSAYFYPVMFEDTHMKEHLDEFETGQRPPVWVVFFSPTWESKSPCFGSVCMEVPILAKIVSEVILILIPEVI